MSDVNAVGPMATMPSNMAPYIPNVSVPNILEPSAPMASGNFNQSMSLGAGSFDNGNASMRNASGVGPQMPQSSTQFYAPRSDAAGNQLSQFSMFQQPIVQDMAMQYGQHLADQGKQIVENQFSKWIPVSKLKYYFAVDNNYVIKKLRLLFFPFIHQV